MNILDRYLLKEYLKAFLVGFFFFSALVVLVRLLDKDIKKFEEGITYLTAVKIVLYQAPRRIMEIVPVAGFVAIFFALGRMVKKQRICRNESWRHQCLPNAHACSHRNAAYLHTFCCLL